MRPSFPRAAILAAALLAAAPAVHAQTADEIVAKNIEAKGGVATLKATTSVRASGKGTMQGAEISFTASTKRPYSFRNEMDMAGQKMIRAFDGETLWMAVGTTPPQALPPGPQTETLKQLSQIDSPLLDYKEKGTKIALGEPLAEDGRKLHHLVVTPKAGPALHFYIDPTTYLEARMVIVDVEDAGRPMKMELRFSDYKTIEGRTIPLTITQFVNGNQVNVLKYEKIEFNVPLEDSIFRMPKQG
ncbi:MAG TPA: hypothetical protein VJ813_07730 [Vicinamibacterales bacterium]|nr:hypothetical protein [Vicinamibacterales bacterium]